MRTEKISQSKRPPEGGLCSLIGAVGSGHAKRRSASAISHKTNPSKAQDHHGPSAGFGDGGNFLKEAADFAAWIHTSVNVEVRVAGFQSR